MIEERLRGVGGWDLQLREDTPVSVRAALDFFGHILIVPTHVDPNRYSDATMLSLARYTGILRRRADHRTRLAGAGLAAWLGDEDGKGAVYETAVTRAAGSLTQWIGDLLPASIASGTITDPGGTLTWSTRWVAPRVAIDFVCDFFGVDWVIDPTATIDVGVASVLFNTTPTAITFRRGGGRDLTLVGLQAEALAAEDDVEDYTTRCIVLGEGSGDTIGTGAADISPATSYKDLLGNAAILRRIVNAPETTAGDEAAVAQAQLNRFTATRRAISLSTQTYDIGADVRPGDSLYVWDLEDGLTDTANQVRYRGQILHPAKLRVLGYRWPVRQGMGVYYRTDAGAYIDLTPYVVWEQAPTEFDVGGGHRIRDTPPTPGATERPEASQIALERRG